MIYWKKYCQLNLSTLLPWPALTGNRGAAALLLIFQLLMHLPGAAQDHHIEVIHQPPSKSLRGISVVSAKVLWASGTEGQAGRSLDGGKTWEWSQVGDCKNCDWRSLYAFSSEEAIVINAGSPAYVYRTVNGGKEWKKVYEDTSAAIFFDGLQFLDANKGIAIGDPIENKFSVITTQNKGVTWSKVKSTELPVAANGEAIFAASGTSLVVLPGRQPAFVTGGTVARFWKKEDNWKAYTLPVIQGQNTTGAFSVAFRTAGRGIVVGGDYQQPMQQQGNCFLTYDGGKSWQQPVTSPGGYRSCVAFITDSLVIATGTTGTDISEDGGKNWKRIGEGFNAVAADPTGKAVYLIGTKIARLTQSTY